MDDEALLLAQRANIIDAAKKELESDDDDRIKAAYDKLMQDVQQVFTKMYQAGAAAGADNAGAGDNGDTEFHQ